MSRTARGRRLIDLYNLRAQVNSEIAKLEAAIVGEVRLIREQWAAEDPPPRRRKVAECGTDGGYHHHLRVVKERACLACRMAHTAAERDRVARKAAG